MKEKICKITGQKFELSEQEMALREKLGIEGEPEVSPVFRFLQIGAFWQHWSLHKRKCAKTGKDIISVFEPDCPYPVWHKEEWVKTANPESIDFDENKEVFPQMWEVFQKSPIAHIMGAGNENCEYTDDWWYCRNCYLCHSGVNNQDLRYCYRLLNSKDSQFCVFSSDLELCTDVTYSHNCFNVIYGLHCRQCHDSAFLYDCRNCRDCLFCTNLRNKQYCFNNEQLTKEEYEKKKTQWDFSSRQKYEQAKSAFKQLIKEKAWHRAAIIDRSENVTGDYLDGCKNCANCYLISEGGEDCINCARQGKDSKDTLDSISAAIQTERVFYSSLAQDQCYEIKFGYNLIQCKYLEYSAHCFQCAYCFGCCGLVGKKYYIFNKPYSPEEYQNLKTKIIAKMKQTGEYGNFFPGYFAANPYEKSWSYFYWPLSRQDQQKYGFRLKNQEEKRSLSSLDESLVPDNAKTADESIINQIFWDNISSKPFQIQKADLSFSNERGVPLPNSYYIRRIQENFKWIPFQGYTRQINCGKCHNPISTSWPVDYEGKILCESCYQKEVY